MKRKKQIELSLSQSARTFTGAACLLGSALPKPPLSAFLAREMTRQRRAEGRKEDRDESFIIVDVDDEGDLEVEQPLPLFLDAPAAAAGAAQRKA